MNYYKLLNVSVKADDKELKKAYRNLAKKYHPDMYQGDKKVAEDKMQDINEAYDTLSDANRRKEYDLSIGLSRESKEEQAYTSTHNNTSNSYNTSNYTSRQNVKYRPNHTNTYYDSNGYAETNYSTYTGERYRRNRYEEEIKFDVKNVAVKITVIVLIAIIAITFSISMIVESISELSSNKLIYGKSENNQNDVHNIETDDKIYYTPSRSNQNKEENTESLKSIGTNEIKNGLTSEELKKELEKLDIDEEKLKQVLIELKDALEKYNEENNIEN